MEMSFISICDELHVFEMARDWPKKSESEKLAIAGNIIRRFVERIQSDIKSGHAKKYNDTVIDNVPKISVTRAQLFYVDGHDDFGLYESNPLELNANTRRREFGDIVRTKIALCEYMRAGRTLGNVRAREMAWGR